MCFFFKWFTCLELQLQITKFIATYNKQIGYNCSNNNYSLKYFYADRIEQERSNCLIIMFHITGVLSI